ncbi:hypothetical protein J3R83DRAFT_6356 [Lanmaoa asiatica]|nr:hypothetical protein J3R83DRAFT_6356 [Lanmaoa asiatica]
MAKPKHGRWNHYAELISPSDAHRPPQNPDPLQHKQPCSRKHTVARSLPRFPSPALLSALAIIATTPPVVAGGPLPLPTPPPTFLCPFIERDNINTSPDVLVTLAPRAGITSSSTPSPTPTPTSKYSKHEAVADKYVQGPDRLWRKTDAWTLYGSTCCSSSTTSTSSIQSQPSSSQTPIPTSTAQFDTSVLPAGWNNTTNSSTSTESTIILALAIILAGSICVFMIGCLIWRRRKKRTRDIERKLAHKLGADDDSQDNVREKDARGKMRMWAKASTRWRFNIRQSARRRRKRPMVSSIANRPLSPTFSDSPQVSVVVPSAPSRRNSFVSQGPDSSRPETTLCPNGYVTEPPAVLHDPPRSSSPPTYGASFISGFSHLPPSAVSNPSSTPSSDNPHPVQRSNEPSVIEDELLPYIPPSDGHIATDDKAQLAHIRELASSPMADTASPSTMQSVSAPEWHEVEDDLDGLGIDLSEVPTTFQNFGLPPSFPPPPSKADVPFGYLDDHPLRYGEGDDILFSLPVPGTLGPSLEAFPSAPPIDEPGLEPSAPSLEGLFQYWDWGFILRP